MTGDGVTITIGDQTFKARSVSYSDAEAEHVAAAGSVRAPRQYTATANVTFNGADWRRFQRFLGPLVARGHWTTGLRLMARAFPALAPEIRAVCNGRVYRGKRAHRKAWSRMLRHIRAAMSARLGAQ